MLLHVPSLLSFESSSEVSDEADEPADGAEQEQSSTTPARMTPEKKDEMNQLHEDRGYEAESLIPNCCRDWRRCDLTSHFDHPSSAQRKASQRKEEGEEKKESTNRRK